MSHEEQSSSGRQPISPAKRKQLQKCFEHANKMMMQNNHDYANEMFQRCILGDPGNVIYIQSFVGNLIKKYDNNKKGSKMAFIKGAKSKSMLKKNEMQKHWDKVIELGVELLQLNPWDASTLVSMATAVSEIGYDEAQLAFLKMALNVNPEDVEINRICAHELRSRGEFDQALACWGRVVKVLPDDQEAKKEVADITVEKTIKKGRYEQADLKSTREAAGAEQAAGHGATPEQTLEREIKKEPENASLYKKLAETHLNANQFSEAESVLQRGLEAIPGEVDLKEILLDVQRRRLHAELASTKEQFEATKSEQAKARFYELKEQYNRKTVEVHQFRVERYPHNLGFRYDLGITYQGNGMYKEAIAEFQQAKNDKTRVGPCLLALGQCFQQIKQYKLALSHYEEAIQAISDQDVENRKKVLYLAAKLAFGLKELDKAEKYATLLAGIDFSYKDVSELLDKISNQGNIG